MSKSASYEPLRETTQSEVDYEAGDGSAVTKPLGATASQPPPYANQASSSTQTGFHPSYVEEFGNGSVGSGGGDQFIDQADEIIRAGFVRKVFGLLGVQLLVTSAIIALFSLVDPITKYVDLDETNGGHPWVFITAMVLSTTCILALACFPQQARTYPNK